MSNDTVICVVGNATDDPTLRFTAAGVAVANVTVASTPRQFDKATNEWKDGATLFLRCNIWREMAENVAESVVKGTRLVVQGRLVQRSFVTKEGDNRTVVELEVDEIAPSLRYATAKVNRTARDTETQYQRRQQPERQQQAAAPDPWGSAPPAGNTGGGSWPQGDEPPFAY